MTTYAASLVAKIGIEGATTTKSELEAVGNKAKETESSFKKLKEQVARGFEFGTGMQLAQIPGSIFDAAKEQFGEVIKLALDHQQIMAQTNQVLKSTRDVSKMSAESLDELAQALGKTTMFSADTVQGGENLLLTFTNIGKSVFPQATQAILDVSQAMHQDLKESAIQVGKALGDPLTGMTALQRIGVTFSATEKEQIKTMMAHNDIIGAQKVILHELNTEFGGSAVAAGKTFAGGLKIAQDRLEELKIKIGTALLPILNQFLQYFEIRIMPRLEDFSTWFQRDGIPKITQFGQWFEHDGIPLLSQFGTDIGIVVGDLGNFVKWLQKGGLGADQVKVAIVAVGTAFAAVKIAQFGKSIFDTMNSSIKAVSSLADNIVNLMNGAALKAEVAETGIGKTMKTTVARDVAEGAAEAEIAVGGIGTKAVETQGVVATQAGFMKSSLAGVLGLYGVLLAMEPIVAQKVADQRGPLEQQIAELKARGQAIPPYLRQAAHDAGVPGYASGIGSAPGGWSLVGERGPEMMYVPQGASILPTGTGPSGGSQQPINVNVYLAGAPMAKALMPHIVTAIRGNVGSVGY